MSDIVVHPRREWSPEDEAKLREYLQKEGYDTFRLYVEKMICELNQEVLAKRNFDCIAKIEALSTLLRLCDHARK